jgi:FkbM family methyltransferase
MINKNLKSFILKKLGYRKIESPYKILNAFEAQQKFIDEKSSPIIFDIGASIGQTASQYRTCFPRAKINCFEPIDVSLNQLKERFSNDSKTQCFQIALTCSEGEKTFYLNKGPETSSLLPSTQESSKWAAADLMENVRSLSVPTTTLDAFCQKAGINKIDILKMDTQGAELSILKGAANLLSTEKIGIIYSEVLFVPLYEGQASFHDIGSFLSPYGYRLFDLFHHRYSSTGQIKWADALFIKG